MECEGHLWRGEQYVRLLKASVQMLVVFCKKESKLTSLRFKAAAERRHSDLQLPFFPPCTALDVGPQ